MSLLLLGLASCAGVASADEAPREHTATPATGSAATASLPAAPSRATPDSRPPAGPAALSPTACLGRLDAAVRQAERGDVDQARRRLERLASGCAHLPQVHHDLGVIAARDGRPHEAAGHFEAALAADPRAMTTLEHLRALHRREAAAGYARALDRPFDAPLPPFAFQRSNDVGADTLRARAGRDAALRDVATLEYELYAWWRSAVDGDPGQRLAHYADDYPRALALAGLRRDAALRWEDVRREIAFTSEDAVAVLEHAGQATDRDGGPPATDDDAAPAAADPVRRLLLLRLQGDRWLIYRDTPL